MIKTLSEWGIEGSFLNLIKYHYKNPAANIILNGETLKLLPEDCDKLKMLISFSLLSFITVLVIWPSGINQVENWIRAEKEEMKLSLFTYDTIVPLKNPKESAIKLSDLISALSKLAEYLLNMK